MAETIRNEKEEKKTKAEVPGVTKKDKKASYFKPQYLRNGWSQESGVRYRPDLNTVKKSAPPRQPLWRY